MYCAWIARGQVSSSVKMKCSSFLGVEQMSEFAVNKNGRTSDASHTFEGLLSESANNVDAANFSAISLMSANSGCGHFESLPPRLAAVAPAENFAGAPSCDERERVARLVDQLARLRVVARRLECEQRSLRVSR